LRNPLACSSAEPAADRHGESHLPPGQDLVRQEVPHRPAQDVFRRAASQLEPLGKRGRKLDELMVEERHAALDRRGHAHLVLLHQQFVQVCEQVDVQQLVEERTGVGFAKQAVRLMVRIDRP
jgi:hypothetical protein